MPPITVDPEVLSGAGESIGSVGDEIAAAVSTLASSLSGGARSGLDPAGLVFGHAYGQTSQALLDAGAAAANAGRGVGFGVQMSATNYSRADAASTIGGGATALNPPDTPAEFSAPASPSALGGGVAPPLLWSVIQTFIPDVWPDGDPGALRATGSAWQTFASTINGIAGQLTGPSGVVAGQQIPEGGAMTTAITELTQSLSAISSEAGKLATQTLEFADDVENTQNAIRDLLDRVSPSGLLDGIQAVFSGDALEELKEVAEDVKTVLGGYGRQAEARRDMLQIGMGAIDDAVVSVEKWARREFPKYLGEDVGNALATGLDFQLTLGEGVLAGAVDTVESIGQFDPLRFAYDPEGAKNAWAGMAESLGESLLYATPTGVLANPAGAFNHYKEQATDAVHAEDWSSDRSGYGLGKILFDVGAAVVPGGAALRGTKVAGEAVDAATPGRVPDVPTGAIDNLAPIGQRADDITAKLDSLDDNISTTPMAAGPNGPAIPEALVDPPKPPGTPESPGTPRVPDAPEPNVPGSPTPHVQDSTPIDRSPAPHSSAPVAQSPDSHSPTPTSTPAHTPAGVQPESGVPAGTDASSAPQQSSPESSAGSVPTNGAPPVASQVPEAAPAATPHTSISTPADVSPAVRDAGELPGDNGSHPSGAAETTQRHGGDQPDGHPRDTSESGTPQTPPEGPRQDPIHSHELSGEGWHRLDDDPVDPHYGEPLSEHWVFDEDPVDPARINPDVLKLMEDPNAPFGRAPDGHAYSQREYEERFNLISSNGDHYQNFPLNDGAVPGTKVAFTELKAFVEAYGDRLDRIGEDGKYLAVMDNGLPASWESRAMHVESLGTPYNAYKLDHLPSGWKIEASEVAPGGGQPGGSIQVRVIGADGKAVPVDILKEFGVLQ